MISGASFLCTSRRVSSYHPRSIPAHDVTVQRLPPFKMVSPLSQPQKPVFTDKSPFCLSSASPPRSSSHDARSADARGKLSALSDTSCRNAERWLCELNNSLRLLAQIFPNIRPEVFREMLTSISDESRLYVVTEMLLKDNEKWIKGRWRISARETSSKILKEVFEVEQTREQNNEEKELVPLEETFRTEAYKAATRTALSQEFKVLSKSTIEGVLAEQNYSYSLSRPVLLGLAAKTWRKSLSTFLSRWRKPSREATESHYMVMWVKPPSGGPITVPKLSNTRSAELNQELHDTVLAPLLAQRTETQETISQELAVLLNEQEAESAKAMYECECCFSETTFEAMATCTTGEHTICFKCVQNAVSEALYGQSWGLNIDHDRSQVACLAPCSTLCSGCIPRYLARRAVLQTRGGSHTWEKLQHRLAEDAMRSSGAEFVRCPFCPYAELDDLYLPLKTVKYRLNRSYPFGIPLFAILTSFIWLIIVAYHLLNAVLPLPPILPRIHRAINNLVYKTHLPARFICRNPACARRSCRLCKAAWRDPHTCHEAASLSLRTTVEAARTAALKRTCPRCSLAFVKESGCNKMVCVCGYTMCYVCRQGLGGKTAVARNDQAPHARNGAAFGANMFRIGALLGEDGDDGAGYDEGAGEGYRHFCQHFRPLGGQCSQCEKCDLYRGEDEDEVVRRAGERAEREWRKREGEQGKGIGVNGMLIRSEISRAKGLEGFMLELLDWFMEMSIKV